ncbi:STAS domain-containing protein [Streptomyces sp. NBC_00503]|uniref:STAS domain-containing protein n=1 Tax=Streptomyces sp. NBC_00503 TaxID=2903659 RepID=UPI002E7FC5C0|nr:STAS domain-containing protein [Streptomyces sp. NBC_00503]WUD84870.1 STAS domain-containing protein [Streptomyces sp. NBC_00503]
MRVPDPNAHRYDENGRVLIAPAGELDISTVHSLRASLARCLDDGVRTIDIDLSAVTFCDCSGLGVLLSSWWRITAAGGTLRLHHPPPALVRIIDITRSGFLLGDPPAPLLTALPAGLGGVL